jgi:hypothetical protein
MMNQMMKECLGEDGKPDVEKMKGFMDNMMKQCCGDNGMADFERMKGFMKMCGKSEFTDEEMQTMRQLCGC